MGQATTNSARVALNLAGAGNRTVLNLLGRWERRVRSVFPTARPGGYMKIRLWAIVLLASAQLAGCGGGGGGGTPPPPTYSIGGAITGLTGSGLVLQLNGGSNLPVNANATAFTFVTQLVSGAAYAVSVLTQPTNPSQTCTVSHGSRNVGSANLPNVRIPRTTNSFTVVCQSSRQTG